ncbi:hypothetical protein [Acidocella facilis]|uniref:hypothetical protein n=1 Tax=Acidocella facilis TaxID=525 RepID=UPI001F46DB12|nr:hypothetical protein [Acidocella facilis]
MNRSMMGFGAWTNWVTQSAMLMIESQQVIALRLAKLAAGGPDVQREAELMVSEKVQAIADSGQMVMKAAAGGHSDMGAGKVLTHYRSKVRANRRRLSK